ncbi:ATV_HP_G0103640.mRNA.1.CDS.1 [Saccharomyces cerevisiae]|nr:ATV_HP_G0103640.mRNA.1.CDS.1 [Saccharomyces cerevisiae]CAI6619572.1 ATV_HP_G0103640.mRNA.1.CDS.1 [Saccharomyces cerevisiae]
MALHLIFRSLMILTNNDEPEKRNPLLNFRWKNFQILREVLTLQLQITRAQTIGYSGNIDQKPTELIDDLEFSSFNIAFGNTP